MRLLMCSAAMACIALTAPQAVQAQDLGSNFKRDKNVSVRQRPRPDYEATGQKAGGFTLYPRITADVERNDNIYAVASGKTSDTIWRVKPEMAVRSDWSRHALGLFAGGNIIRYSDNSSENAEEYTVSANGRLDIERGSNLTGSVQTQRLVEPRTSPTSPSAAGKPVKYDLTQGTVAYVKEFNRLRVSGRLDDKDFNYKDVPNIAGTGIVDQDFRDRNEFYYGAKAEYAVSPDTAVYLSATGNKKDYDTNIVASDRTSDGYVVGVGGFGEVVHRPGLHRLNRRGDVAVAGEHDDLRVGPRLAHRLDHLQARAVLQPHVQHREGRRVNLHRGDRLLHAADQGGFEPTLFQRATEPGSKGRVVVEHKQALVRQRGDVCREVGHAWSLIRIASECRT